MIHTLPLPKKPVNTVIGTDLTAVGIVINKKDYSDKKKVQCPTGPSRRLYIFQLAPLFCKPVSLYLYQNTMNNIFYYENGQGESFDEQGNEAVDWEKEIDPFYLKK